MGLSLSRERLAQSDRWYFDDRKWPFCRTVIRGAQERGIPFAVGGSFASLAYCGSPQQPGDLDIFLLRDDCEAMKRITADAGLCDYYDQKPYDRGWIYRAETGGAIVDIIWQMANRRTEVDRSWLERGPEIGVDGVRFRLLPIEELLWTKLYILQHDRCDWPDALNLVHTRRRDLDWRYLLGRVGEDRPLVAALIALFAWTCPDGACDLPSWLWGELGIDRPRTQKGAGVDLCLKRANLLDSRPWFIAAGEEKEAA